MSTITDHDSYISSAPEPFRESLTRLRTLLATALPGADEMVAYRMPGFSVGGVVVASYAAFSKQCGVYFLPEALAECAEAIAAAGFKATKTGITFTPRKPIPEELIVSLAAASLRVAKG